MSKVGKTYKKSVELRGGAQSEVLDTSLITVTSPETTEEFNLDRLDFLLGYGILNPTEEFVPYRADNRFKDSPVQFDVSENIIISSVSAVIPQIVVRAIITQDIAANVDRVYAVGNITLNLEDRGSSGIPVNFRNVSGTTTITADVGTVENPTLTVGQSSTVAFETVDEVWYEE